MTDRIAPHRSLFQRVSRYASYRTIGFIPQLIRIRPVVKSPNSETDPFLTAEDDRRFPGPGID